MKMRKRKPQGEEERENAEWEGRDKHEENTRKKKMEKKEKLLKNNILITQNKIRVFLYEEYGIGPESLVCLVFL